MKQGGASAFVTRFAPSPSGLLHLGHAYSALTAFAAAQGAGGRFLLRIEDIDEARSRPRFEEAIFEDLAWLGLTWEAPVRRQSEHLDDYHAALERLKAEGLLYRCIRTRAETLRGIGSAPHGPAPASLAGPPEPAEEAKAMAEGRPYAWRLSIERARERLGGFEDLFFVEEDEGRVRAAPEEGGDPILAGKGGGIAYHLAVVVDDAFQGVSHVIRGEDLKGARAVQRLLQALLGLPAPIYRHHRLLCGPDGQKLSKRDGAESLAALRAAGVSAAEVRERLGF
ncbi:MAG: tRNA glutamyl-Q(34) synthetase GluQRS [Caulobacteraceae bacterium]